MPKRIDLTLLTEELRTLINASAKIFPLSIVEIQGDINPNGYEYARCVSVGPCRNNIYRWNSTDGKWELIGADDKDISWSDIKERPLAFTPAAHDHNSAYYTKQEVEQMLSGKSDASHDHDDLYSPINIRMIILLQTMTTTICTQALTTTIAVCILLRLTTMTEGITLKQR